MMQEQEKIMTKIQKWLKDMKVEYNFSLKEDTDVLLISAIANSDYLVKYLRKRVIKTSKLLPIK